MRSLQKGNASAAGFLIAILIIMIVIVLGAIRNNSAVRTAKLDEVLISGVHYNSSDRFKIFVDGLAKGKDGKFTEPVVLGEVDAKCKETFLNLSGKTTLARITRIKYTKTYFLFSEEEIKVDGVDHLCVVKDS